MDENAIKVGSKVFDKVGKSLTEPRIWVTFAATCFAAWAALGYHQDQIAAELALVIKSGAATAGSGIGPDLSIWQQVSFVMFCLFLLIAAVCHVRARTRLDQSPVSKGSEQTMPDPSTAAFQPIMAQDEILGRSPPDAPIDGFDQAPSRKVSQFMQSAVMSLTPVKNRQ